MFEVSHIYVVQNKLYRSVFKQINYSIPSQISLIFLYLDITLEADASFIVYIDSIEAINDA